MNLGLYFARLTYYDNCGLMVVQTKLKMINYLINLKNIINRKYESHLIIYNINITFYKFYYALQNMCNHNSHVQTQVYGSVKA